MTSSPVPGLRFVVKEGPVLPFWKEILNMVARDGRYKKPASLFQQLQELRVTGLKTPRCVQSNHIRDRLSVHDIGDRLLE